MSALTLDVPDDQIAAIGGALFMAATAGQIPTSWDDETRAAAQLILDAWEDALIERIEDRLTDEDESAS